MLDLLTGGNALAIIGGIGTVLVGVFGFLFKLRGNKIEKLKVDVGIEKANNHKLKEEIKLKDEAKAVQDEFNEIDKAISNAHADVKRERVRKHFTRD